MSAANTSKSTAPNSPVTRKRSALRPGLQLKFTCLVVGLALAMGMIVGSVTTDYATLIVGRIQTDHCRQEAMLLAKEAAGEYEWNAASLEKLASKSIRVESLLFVSFLDLQGRTLALAVNPRFERSDFLTEGSTPGSVLGQPARLSFVGSDESYLDVTHPVERQEVEGGGDRRIPLPPDHLLGYVRVGYSLRQTLAEVSAASDLLSGIAVLIICLTVPLAYLLVSRLLHPLEDLSKSISRFADGDLTARCHVARKDEIGEIAVAYNTMADRLEQKHNEIIVLNADLEERVQERTRQLRELAARDSLTRLYNRRHFNEVYEGRFAEAKRYGTALSCAMIDLDDFKKINDTHGHQRGDDVLVLTARTIMDELRSSDVAARYGGDEFIILMPQADAEQARQLSRRIMDRLAEAIRTELPDCRLGVSIGIASLTDVQSDSPDDLIRLTDLALYDAKKEGKNTIVCCAQPVA
ncbi:MAG: diguanylate cyclase [Planctomycetes bacterium]|nr:diguanylate cyclase [Planctomycetota bacterium]